jgi:hypothetical protein
MIETPTTSDVLGKCADVPPLSGSVPPLPHLTEGWSNRVKKRRLIPPILLLTICCYGFYMIFVTGTVGFQLFLALLFIGPITAVGVFGLVAALTERKENAG